MIFVCVSTAFLNLAPEFIWSGSVRMVQRAGMWSFILTIHGEVYTAGVRERFPDSHGLQGLGLGSLTNFSQSQNPEDTGQLSHTWISVFQLDNYFGLSKLVSKLATKSRPFKYSLWPVRSSGHLGGCCAERTACLVQSTLEHNIQKVITSAKGGQWKPWFNSVHTQAIGYL